MLRELSSRLAERRGTRTTAKPPTAGSPAGARAGADLRAARTRLGLALTDVAAQLHIRLNYLEALEAGEVRLLPGNAYAVAYIRSYAGAVGLAPDDMVRRFKAEAAEVMRRTELVFPVPMPERGIPAGALVLLGLILSVGAYAGWYRLSADGRLPAETVTEIPQRLAPLAEQALPRPATFVAAIPAPANRIAAADLPASTIVPPPAISPTSAAAAAVPHPVPDEVMAPPTGADESRLTLRASADAWMQVKDRTGTILLNRTLKAGETWPVPPRDNLSLTTGNAGGTEILLDGVATAALGASGVVRRDLPLDPGLIRDGKLATPSTFPFVATRARQ